MKSLLKLISIVLLITIFAELSACGTKSEKNQSSETPSQSSTVVSDPNKPNGNLAGNDLEKTKQIREMLPRLVKDTKNALIDNSEKLWPSFKNDKTQIFLISPSNNIAYLINNQKAGLGHKDTEIEYSTQSLFESNKEFMIQIFGNAEFNGYNTYFINLDMAWSISQNQQDQEKKYERMFQFIIHEGVHILLQNTNEQTGEIGLRADQYPFDVMSRYYRNETYTYLKKAALANNSSEKNDNIKKAVYFHNKYLAENKKNSTMNMYDSVEGLATFIDNKALQLIKNKNATQKELLDLTEKSIINNFMSEDNKNLVLVGNREFYDLGALAIAALVDDGEDISKKIFSNSPIELLKNKFGSMKAEEHKNVKDACTSYYNDHNNKIKAVIDEVDQSKNDDDYVAVHIPVTVNNNGFRFKNENIEYTYKDQQAMIQTVTAELLLGSSDTRVKLNDIRMVSVNKIPMGLPSDGKVIAAPRGSVKPGTKIDSSSLMKMDINMVFQEYTVFIPKKDIKISEDNLLTIQRDDILLFDTAFELKDGEYTILVK